MARKDNQSQYNPSVIEKKWQEIWEKTGIYRPNLDTAKKRFYNLMMFPYPSAEGMHVGNMYAFTGSDIYGRFKRMQGYDVFEPIGLDGFGIHSENYAIKVGRHPKDQAALSEKNFYRQLHSIGNGFDWSRTVETYKPEYYKWTQWIFIQLFKKGLAYRKKAPVNFCPSCKTVLADEQVIDARPPATSSTKLSINQETVAGEVGRGKCERCGSIVEKRQLSQWFFRITEYADALLDGLSRIDWTEKVKIAQREWIGRSEGLVINFDGIDIFTTRPETTDGATFLVLSPQHPKTREFKSREVINYIRLSENKTNEERRKEKTGVFTGECVYNPLTKKKIPIWIADYVLMEYGTGAIMAVPSVDERDREFAKKYKIAIEKTSLLARPEGKKVVNYHLRDWLISRQRYWGPPIPMIHCDKCDWQPVPEDQLPVLLPEVVDWKPKGTGESPLASIPDFVNTVCPNCGGPAKRETDVSDTFLDSAWYFFRYINTDIDIVAFSKERDKKWLPVNMYIGGAEHSVLHLLYTRFLTEVFKDLNLIDFDEPFPHFYAHGLIIKDGAKMSKSKGNVVVPDEYIIKYGSDTVRCYLMFSGPFSQGGDFRDSGVEGMFRFLKRVWHLVYSCHPELVSGPTEMPNQVRHDTEQLDFAMHLATKKVTEDLASLHYNTAIAAIMEYYNELVKNKNHIAAANIEALLLLLAPFAPHMTEELWQGVFGNKESIHVHPLPTYDPKMLVENEVTIVVQVNGKVRDTISVQRLASSVQLEIEKLARESEKVKKYLEGKKIQKVVYIEGKIISYSVTD